MPNAAPPAAERPLLDRVQVQEPCTVSWDTMRGGDRVRFCGQCRLNVYDLSAMTRPAAEALLRGRGERLCVRFQRRADGTIVSQDCGPVRRAVRRRARLLRVAAAGLFAMFFPSALGGCGAGSAGSPAPDAPGAGVPDPAVPLPDGDPRRLQGEVHVPESMGIVACPPDAPTPTLPADDPPAPPK